MSKLLHLLHSCPQYGGESEATHMTCRLVIWGHSGIVPLIWLKSKYLQAINETRTCL